MSDLYMRDSFKYQKINTFKYQKINISTVNAQSCQVFVKIHQSFLVKCHITSARYM